MLGLLIASFRYIVYEADAVNFWPGLKADLEVEESEISWESVLLNRWPNLKAVIATTSTVSEDTNCPVHQVWISSRNAVNHNDPPQDNPLDRISRLIYGKTLSGIAKSTTGREENNYSFKTTLAISKDARPVRSSGISGPGSEDSPFSPHSEAAKFTDGDLCGFDFYISTDASELHQSPTYGQAQHIAFLFCLSRDALPSGNWSMNIACADSVHWLHWLFVVSSFRKSGWQELTRLSVLLASRRTWAFLFRASS